MTDFDHDLCASPVIPCARVRIVLVFKSAIIRRSNSNVLTLQKAEVNNMDPFEATGTRKDRIANLLNAYRDAIDTNIICSITDTRGIMIYVNQKFCEISKYAAHELIGKSHHVINSGYHSKGFFAEMWQTITSGTMWHGEIRNRAKDNSIYWVETVIVPIKDNKGAVINFFSLRIPITDRKNLEYEKNFYLKSIEDLLFMVSHELRRPITSMMGMLNLLKDIRPGDSEYQILLGYMNKSAEELDDYSKKINTYLQEHKDISQARS